MAQVLALLTPFVILGLYLYWLWQQRELNANLLLPLPVLLFCVLLAAGMESYVYQRAEVTGYMPEEGLLRPLLTQKPIYYGESWSVYVACLAPVLGWLLLLIGVPAVRQPTHVVHFLVCLLFFYVPAVCFAIAQTGYKPSYQLHEKLPPIGSKGPQPKPD